MSDVRVPTVAEMKPLVIAALEELGGRGTTTEIRSRVEASPSMGSAVLEIRHGQGKGSEVGYRLRWALLVLSQEGRIQRVAPHTYSVAVSGTTS